MFNRKSVAAFGLALGLMVAAASAHAWDPLHRTTSLTFSRAVSLPGVSLAAGTYVFEVADPESGSNVVRVRATDYRHVYFAGITHRVQRPAGLNANRSIVFGEPAAGMAPPIVAWYPQGDAMGREFIYPR